MEYEKEFKEVETILNEVYKNDKLWYDPELINETIKAMKQVKLFAIPDVSHSTCDNLVRLFQILPQLGMGEAREFNYELKDIVRAYNVLSTIAYMNIVAKRTEENMKSEPTPYKEWELKLKTEDSFCGHMLRNYDKTDGEFEITGNLDDLNNLAGILIGYCG